MIGLIVVLVRYSGAGVSVDRSRVSIATVERGNFIRDISADGQVVAAVSPTLYANALGTVTLKVHAGDTVSKGQVLAVVDSPDLDREALAGAGDPGQPARSIGSGRSSMPSTSSRS